jgi:hypothetical protein
MLLQIFAILLVEAEMVELLVDYQQGLQELMQEG